MRHIDLFSGIGGFALAATWCWGDEYENVGHSEIETFPCKVYHKHFPTSRCLGDITKIDWKEFEGTVDLITGGFPCQPHSQAGKRLASADERDLWGECKRAISKVRPRYALFENVSALLTSERGRFFNRVLSDLAEIGYDAEWHSISASDIGAYHNRERIWIITYPRKDRWYEPKVQNITSEGRNLAERIWTDTKTNRNISIINRYYEETKRDILREPYICRVVDGVSTDLDRVAAIGNAIDTRVALQIMQAIKGTM